VHEWRHARGADHDKQLSTTESRAIWVELGRVQSFMLILGRVGLGQGHFTCGSGWVGQENWTHARPTLVATIGCGDHM